jgi:hypothetical protein
MLRILRTFRKTHHGSDGFTYFQRPEDALAGIWKGFATWLVIRQSTRLDERVSFDAGRADQLAFAENEM